jgi:hypothetical protein
MPAAHGYPRRRGWVRAGQSIVRRLEVSRDPGRLSVGFFGQEIHFVLGGDADDFADIRQIVKLIE